MEVNLIGVINGVRTFLPRFLERGRGHVINVASMAAFAPVPDLATYCATKHAVRALTGQRQAFPHYVKRGTGILSIRRPWPSSSHRSAR